MPKTWTTEDSAALYRVNEWGNGYFGISAQGEATVKATFATGEVAEVSLQEILDGVRERGLKLPLLLRIENLLDAQISKLNDSFRAAIEQQGYPGCYQGVFPIKVNQQRQVIEEIARFGKPYHHGLEAGSRAELMVALGSLPVEGGLIICNGYKDSSFIDLGLRGQQLGYKCIFVLETPAELPLILERSRALGIEPMLGLRVKLSTVVSGHWNLTSGERSIFGLTVRQLVEVVDQLKAEDMLHCLQLLHSHLGSQIPELQDIRSAATEACRFYRELQREGAPMGYLDFGGGLAVDYPGTGSSDSQSCNYSLEDYCQQIVETVRTSLSDAPALPTIVTESGRPTVAYYSLLLFNIFDVTRFEPYAMEPLPPGCHPLTLKLDAILTGTSKQNIQQSYQDCLVCRDELHELFKTGLVPLRERGLVQNLVLAISHKILELLPADKDVPEEFAGLQELTADIYYGNLSVFQSLPDHWAIGQLFPVLPIHRLDEKPDRNATIADITCDSDGRISHFIDGSGGRTTLPLHEIKPGEDYVLGTFLIGAYQETLGDLHNLFGDTNIASVRIEADGSYRLTREDRGDSIADLLGYVQYDARVLKETFRNNAEEAVRTGRISVTERQEILASFSAGLDSYSYYES